MEKKVRPEEKDTKRRKNHTIVFDNHIALIKDLKDLNLQQPFRMDAFSAILCLRGKFTLYINNKIYEIKAKEMLLCHPDIVLEKSMNSLDIKYLNICLSKEYLHQLSMPSSSNMWDIFKFLEQSPVLSLNDEEVEMLCRIYDLIEAKITSTTKQQYKKDILDNLLQAFIYELGEVLNRFISIKPSMFTAAEKMFREFLELISGLSPKPRSVNYYADKLCITPKYLSTICKEASGQNASDLIHNFVVKDIEYQLRIPGKSIKEVCNDLDFPNLSFFGRYVKKHMGISPKQWREKNT